MVINGIKQTIPSEIQTINQLKAYLNIKRKIAIAHNNNIINSSEFDDAILEKDSVLELFNFVGGGWFIIINGTKQAMLNNIQLIIAREVAEIDQFEKAKQSA